MRRFSTTLSYRLVRHLSTTATTTAVVRSHTLSINKARWMIQGEQDPDKALQIYNSISDKHSNPISTRYAAESIVQCLAKAHRFRDIESFIDSHKNDPKITHEPFFCTLIRCYGKAGMFDNALKLYGQMKDLGTPRTCYSYNAVLSAANDSKLFDRVPNLFVELPERHGFKPDELSYGALVKSYCESGVPEMGLKVFRDMEEKGVEVTAVSLTMLFDALCKNGKKDEAERVWSEVVGKGCVLDVGAWNVRIAHAHEGLPETLKDMIDQMSAAGLKPDSITYNYLITCYCRNDRLDEAMKVFGELEKNGFKPKAPMYRTLVYYSCRKEDYARGYYVFKKSVKYRKMPDFETVKELVEGMMKNNMKKDAKSLIRTVKKKFPPSFLDAWMKVEVELGLVSDETSTDSNVPKAQMAAK